MVEEAELVVPVVPVVPVAVVMAEVVALHMRCFSIQLPLIQKNQTLPRIKMANLVARFLCKKRFVFVRAKKK